MCNDTISLLSDVFKVNKKNKQSNKKKALFETAKAGNENKKQGNYPRNFGPKEYIFDSQNSSKPSHSKRWIKRLNKGWRGENRKNHPAAEGSILHMKKMLSAYVDPRKTEIWVYGPCELGSDALEKSDELKLTPLQLWHRDDRHGVSRYEFSTNNCRVMLSPHIWNQTIW